MNWQRDGFEVSDDPARLDMEFIARALHATYWAANRTREQIETSVKHSVCFGLYQGTQQVGLARAVTDHATFAYLCDVIIAPDMQGRGLGKWLVECVLSHPALQVTTQCLRTKDAHSLYTRHGFQPTEYLRRSTVEWTKPSE